ncbi:HD-GYP domain-containing protein [Undibacterium sp. CY18W]|uniref:HD-GYP domain-containing protein n=1 Tax=Undibacterium hunanense TaxID=2762292 RepID=A0ABR6ZYW1_9BURK|nr:HD-GYP domain-containing protein [Undibacterium hunanense]MBC3921078.1 HD-GYP domain-containing protein [Undibacterium hunanense]
MSDDSQLIVIDQVRIGMFIKLDLSWFEHSFPMNSFKITSQQQIDELLGLKLRHVRYLPSKSDPLSATPVDRSIVPTTVPTATVPAASAAPSAPAGQVYASIIDAKRARFEKLQKQREEIARCEEKFVKAATVVKSINKLIFSQPAETIQEASKLVDSMAEVFLSGTDTVMHLIQQTAGSEEMYFHTLNVSVLAMMLAHEMKCSPAQIKTVGIASLFHDLGKVNVPEHILNKTGPLTKPEQNFFELHTQYGVEVGQKAGLPATVLDVIAQHHEFMDGSGYPHHLKGEAIRMPSRIVTIANVYDNLCNHNDHSLSLTPHEALSTMYAHRRTQFDQVVMATLVKSLGVYPPGTLVRLSNEAIGLVMNVNVGKPLRPRVLMYDAEIPKEDAIILDLAEESKELSISASIRPGLLPRAIYEYLNPRKRVNYYFDSQSKKTQSNPLPGAR